MHLQWLSHVIFKEKRILRHSLVSICLMLRILPQIKNNPVWFCITLPVTFSVKYNCPYLDTSLGDSRVELIIIWMQWTRVRKGNARNASIMQYTHTHSLLALRCRFTPRYECHPLHYAQLARTTRVWVN